MERLSREAKVPQESYNAPARKYQASGMAVAQVADSIRVVEQPVVPTEPVAPKRKLIVVRAGVLEFSRGSLAP